jgi:hypothetical protein
MPSDFVEEVKEFKSFTLALRSAAFQQISKRIMIHEHGEHDKGWALTFKKKWQYKIMITGWDPETEKLDR